MRSNLCIAGRYLPFIHHDVDLLVKHYSFSSRYNVTTNENTIFEFSKDSCCGHCIKGVFFWLDVSRRQGDQKMRNFIIFVNQSLICPTKVHHQFVLLQTFLEKTNGTISFSCKNYLLGVMFIFEKDIQNTDFWLEMLLCRTYY